MAPHPHPHPHHPNSVISTEGSRLHASRSGETCSSRPHRQRFLQAIAIAFLFATFTPAKAQNCGLSKVEEKTPLVYPPIGVAAHIGGTIAILTRFAHNGSVEATHILSGPPMLQQAALTYVMGLQANTSEGSRECPMIISFELANNPPPNDCGAGQTIPTTIRHTDPQHIAIEHQQMWECDPSATIYRRRYCILGFCWYSKPFVPGAPKQQN